MTAASFPMHGVPSSEMYEDPHGSGVTSSNPSSSPMPRSPTAPEHAALPEAAPARTSSASASPAQSSHGDGDPHESRRSEAGEEEGPTVLQEESDVEGAGAVTGNEKRGSRLSHAMLPPSPPLTSADTDESRRPDSTQHGTEVEELDVADWHPLEHTRIHSVDVNQTQDATVVEDGDVVDSNGRLLFDENDEKPPSPASPRQGSAHLHLDLKTPPSQPWDLVDPPTTNGPRSPEFYSTGEPKNFRTLQSKK